MGKVVDREGELVAVLALSTLWGDDASVVYEHIEAIVLREDTFRQIARGFERGEVGQVVKQLLVACLFAYSVQGGTKAFHVPAVQQHRSALPREFLRDAPAQAVCGTRYEYGRFCRVSHGYSFLSMTSQFACCTESILGHGPTPRDRCRCPFKATVTTFQVARIMRRGGRCPWFY